MDARTPIAALLVFVALSAEACARPPATPASLTSGGADVAVAVDTPSDGMASFVGAIEVSDEASGVEDATEAARTKLRNEAARMGATLVTVDSDRGEKVFMEDAIRVTLTGRAFRNAD